MFQKPQVFPNSLMQISRIRQTFDGLVQPGHPECCTCLGVFLGKDACGCRAGKQILIIFYMSRLREGGVLVGIGVGMFFAHALYSGNERFYRERVMPVLHTLVPDGERAHTLALGAIRHGIWPVRKLKPSPELERTVFGLKFAHPVGLAAGFDKNGEAVVNLLKSGFSHVEVGTVTPQPQPGNPRPRIFRWGEQKAIINRCGFNSEGQDVVYERLKTRPWEGKGIVGINLGCNKGSLNPVADYVSGVEKFGEIADYLVINVSSPNTPGLRSLQRKTNLRELLTQVLKARDGLRKKTPVLLKISPDESDQDLEDIVKIAVNPKTRIDGLIVSNTTLASYDEAVACGAAPSGDQIDPSKVQNPHTWGGLSGPPLRKRSTECLFKIAALTKGQLPLIGVGGVSTPEDAAEKLAAGASLVQLYTSLVYQGPPVARRIVEGLQDLKEKTGVQSEVRISAKTRSAISPSENS
ncbi:unnamed protein product [Calicophoron daubneyi]|uniref:Dihydroorotate dehydrogenase (quinone), mitochondrial n=1 Tax=Calicophoron daubneyi TaxID=300641 RepID=A0AAV2TN02_CALDB